MRKLFELYQDGKLVKSGNADVIAEYLIVDKTNIYMAAKSGSLMFNKFSVKEIGMETKKKVIEPKPEGPSRKTRHQEKLEYLIQRLTRDDITTLKGNPEEFIAELKKAGIKITYRRSVFSKKDYLIERIE